MPVAPVIRIALACAPDIPPRPDVTKVLPFKLLPGCFNLPAFNKVIVVPCTMPCGPMYMYDPAVIWPYWVTPMALNLFQSSLEL